MTSAHPQLLVYTSVVSELEEDPQTPRPGPPKKVPWPRLPACCQPLRGGFSHRAALRGGHLSATSAPERPLPAPAQHPLVPRCQSPGRPYHALHTELCFWGPQMATLPEKTHARELRWPCCPGRRVTVRPCRPGRGWPPRPAGMQNNQAARGGLAAPRGVGRAVLSPDSHRAEEWHVAGS